MYLAGEEDGNSDGNPANDNVQITGTGTNSSAMNDDDLLTLEKDVYEC